MIQLPQHLWKHIITRYLVSIEEINQKRHKKKIIADLNKMFNLDNPYWLSLQYSNRKNRFFKIKLRYGVDSIIDFLILMRQFNLHLR